MSSRLLSVYMSIRPPIGPDNLESLPDDTGFIEGLAGKEDITTVLPRFYGNQGTGRFVAAFFVFRDKKVTLFCRSQPSEGVSGPTKTDTVALVNDPTICEDLWNQTIFIEGEDMYTIESLKQRAEYETIWLTYGEPVQVPFDEFRDDNPFEYRPGGLPECNHTESASPLQEPNTNIVVVPCDDCDIPLYVVSEIGAKQNSDLFRGEFLGVSSEDETLVTVSTRPEGETSSAEIVLHMLTRFAHAEQQHMDFYNRNERLGMVFVHEGIVKGHLIWTEHNDVVALQQIYVFPQFRGAGLAAEFIEAWFEQAECNWFFAIEPNPAARRVHEKLGHFDDGTARPATVVSCRDTLDPNAVTPGTTE